MFLILGEPGDQVAASVARHLPAAATVWVTPAQMVQATWTHRLDQSGAWFQLRLGARTVDSREVTAALNRLRWLPVSGFSQPVDAEYAAMEWQALALSAMATLGERVVNRPCPPSPAGPSWSALEWVRAAGRLGLPVRRLRATTDARRYPGDTDDPYPWRWWLLADPPPGEPAQRTSATVPIGPRPIVWVEPVTRPRTSWVVGGQLLGDHRPGDPDAHALAQAAACSLLRIDLAHTSHGATVLTGADPFPEQVPEEVARACAAHLRQQANA